jgi:hypothetical protein
MINFGPVPLGAVLPVFFASYAGSTGASVTLTGLAVTDVEIYKGTSMTQRASDAGYTLLDTDGIDVDGTTGIHAFSIDTGDNTDSGFFAAGSFYTVIVSAVTVDSQTVNFIAATFRIVPAESSAGVAKVDVTHFGGTAGTFSSGRPEVNTTHIAGTAWASTTLFTLASHDPGATIGTSTLTQTQVTGGAYALNSASFAFNAALDLTTTQKASVNAEADTALSDVGLTSTVTGRIDVATSTRLASASYTAPLDAAGTRSAVGLASANLDTQIATLATASNLATVAGYIDTEVAAIKAKTDNLPASPAATGDIPSAAEIADAVWDEAIAGHAGAGSTGEALAAAGAAGDPWITALPGAYSAGQAGYIVGTFLDAAISTRLATSGYTAAPTATQNADALLNRDMSAVSDTNSRSPLNALRHIRNKWSVSGTTLTVTKEDDTTTAWTSALSTSPGADPITGSDPA